MEKCAKFNTNEAGQVLSFIREVPCEAQVVAQPTLKEVESQVPKILITGGFIVAAIILLTLSILIVKQQTVRIIERLGKFKTVLTAGLRFKIPFIDRVAGEMDLRTQQLTVAAETKTKDNVFVCKELGFLWGPLGFPGPRWCILAYGYFTMILLTGRLHDEVRQ